MLFVSKLGGKNQGIYAISTKLGGTPQNTCESTGALWVFREAAESPEIQIAVDFADRESMTFRRNPSKHLPSPRLAFNVIAMTIALLAMLFAIGPTQGASAEQTNLSIRAKGSTGDEVLEVRFVGTPIATFAVGTAWDTFMVEIPQGFSLKTIDVAFVNDKYEPPYDRNLHVDWVEYRGQRYETELESTYSEGSWTTDNGCAPGKKSTEVLHCNGFFRYNGADLPEFDLACQIEPVVNGVEVYWLGFHDAVTITARVKVNGQTDRYVSATPTEVFSIESPPGSEVTVELSGERRDGVTTPWIDCGTATVEGAVNEPAIDCRVVTRGETAVLEWDAEGLDHLGPNDVYWTVLSTVTDPNRFEAFESFGARGTALREIGPINKEPGQITFDVELWAEYRNLNGETELKMTHCTPGHAGATLMGPVCGEVANRIATTEFLYSWQWANAYNRIGRNAVGYEITLTEASGVVETFTIAPNLVHTYTQPAGTRVSATMTAIFEDGTRSLTSDCGQFTVAG